VNFEENRQTRKGQCGVIDRVLSKSCNEGGIGKKRKLPGVQSKCVWECSAGMGRGGEGGKMEIALGAMVQKWSEKNQAHWETRIRGRLGPKEGGRTKSGEGE